jgi:hypothetical protein
VQVHYGEGVANHAGPELCTAYREVCGEALTGERAGQHTAEKLRQIILKVTVRCIRVFSEIASVHASVFTEVSSGPELL